MSSLDSWSWFHVPGSSRPHLYMDKEVFILLRAWGDLVRQSKSAVVRRSKQGILPVPKVFWGHILLVSCFTPVINRGAPGLRCWVFILTLPLVSSVSGIPFQKRLCYLGGRLRICCGGSNPTGVSVMF